MSWTDLKSLETMRKLRDRFNIQTFIETGTFKGHNAEIHSADFPFVYTVEKVPEYYEKAVQRLAQYPNVFPILRDSSEWLKLVSDDIKNKLFGDIVMIYLDAHFYDASLSPEEKWVVLKELRALEDVENCVIAIHDCLDHRPDSAPAPQRA